MKRSIVIGDIHGGLKALIDLIRKINIQKSDRIIFLGDYVDGWSQSAETIDYLIKMQKVYECIFIKGNHDCWCEDWLKSGYTDDTWLKHGGKMTVKSYKNIIEKNKEIHLEFFGGLKNYYVDESNRLFIHAGFSSLLGPENEAYTSKNSWDRSLWEMALTMDKRVKKMQDLYPKILLLFKEIYIGHTPTTNYGIDLPMQACNVWNVDTGAAFLGRISALDVDTKNIWQSEPCYKLYPTENGRNKTP